MRRFLLCTSSFAWFVLILVTPMDRLNADTVTMRNGIQLEGDIGATSKIGELAEEFGSGGTVIIVDDGLRRTFVGQKQVANISQEILSENLIRISQPVSSSVDIIRGVGQPLFVGSFNEFGRRVVVLPSPDGPRDFIQGITKISPTYCVLETLTTKKFNTKWESRISTTSIPRRVLSAVIQRSIDPTNPNERLQIVQLLIEAERYKDAVVELELFLNDFPDLNEKKNLADSLRQAYARQIIREIQRRRDSGQHEQAYKMLRQFPASGIAGEILGQVLEIKQEHDNREGQLEQIRLELQQLSEQSQQGNSLEIDQKALLSTIIEEIVTEINLNNIGRLSGYYRFRDDSTQTIDQKLAYAISGWILGEADSAGNLQVAMSLVQTRDFVREYLRSVAEHERVTLLERFDGQEGASVANLAKIVANLKAPIREDGDLTETGIPGFFEITLNDERRPFHYWVQLPPEYDPYRRYPCIVTLNDTQSEVEQVDWWAGPYNENVGQRLGQAARHGYIVIAPKWQRDEQLSYEFTPGEHARVLDAVRNAMQRFSIDSDRMFISGHSDGGDAAWDISLSHPDLWAGFLAIGASASNYINHYHSNANGTLAMYFVHGGFDHPRMSSNKMDWNRYLKAPNCDVMIVSYQGRGHEHFQEEVIRMYDWMNLHSRIAAPDELDVRMMRPWDRFFYWIEVDQFPEATMIMPARYATTKNRSAAFIEAQRYPENNLIRISKCSARSISIGLSPDILNLDLPVEITSRSGNFKGIVQPDREVLLEDARLRGERQRPFWARIELGRPSPEKQ